MNRYLRLINKMFEITQAKSLTLSALDKDRNNILSDRYNSYPVFIKIDDDYKENIWGHVKYESVDKYYLIDIIENRNINKDEAGLLLVSALEILYNLDTEFRPGLEIVKKDNKFKLIRHVIKQEWDWANDYWSEIECPKCEYQEDVEYFNEEWVEENHIGYYIYHCPKCEHVFKES